jgi:hypothetical protein
LESSELFVNYNLPWVLEHDLEGFEFNYQQQYVIFPDGNELPLSQLVKKEFARDLWTVE